MDTPCSVQPPPPLLSPAVFSPNQLFTWKGKQNPNEFSSAASCDLAAKDSFKKENKRERDPPLLCAQALPHPLHCF